MKLSLTTALLAASILSAQEPPAPPTPPPAAPAPNSEAAIIPIKTLTGESFDRLVGLLKVFGARFSADSQLRTIVVYAPKDVVTQMRHVIEELDRPGSDAAIGRNIELTVTLLKCSAQPSTDAVPLPADMEPVARQLRSATQCKDIQVWDVLPLRIQEGRQAQQELHLPGIERPMLHVNVLAEAVGKKPQGRYVRFSRLNFRIRVSTSGGYNEVNVETAGDLIEGQKSVLGKVSGTEQGSAVFVVIALKVID